MVDYNFTITAPLEIEETFEDRVILSGTVLKLDSTTKNGRIYQIEEGEQIANGLVGMPVYFGAKPIDNKHDKDEKHPVGRVFKTIFDKAEKVIKAWVEVWNNSRFPDLVKRITKNWGFSIGGIAKDLQETGAINSIGRAIKKVFGMKPNHLQLLEPDIPRGQDDAKVDEVKPIEETLNFDPCPWGACEVPIAPVIQESKVEVPPVEESKPDPPRQIIIRRTTKRVIFLDDADSTVMTDG